MPEFFKSWRRQTGCVALVTATIVMIECFCAPFRPNRDVAFQPLRSGSEVTFDYDFSYLQYVAFALPLTIAAAVLLLWPPKTPYDDSADLDAED